MKGNDKGGITGRGMGWELANSWWILFSFAALTWIGFFIIGKKARQKKWIAMGVIFCFLQFGLVFAAAISDIVIMIWIAAYFAGIIVSFASRKKYLICRDVLLDANISEQDDRQLRASIIQDYQKQGVQVPEEADASDDALTAAVRDAMQQDIPDENYEMDMLSRTSQEAIPQTADQPAQSPLDINNCTEQEMSGLSGISVAQAKKAVEYRRIHGGFSTVDEFFQTIALKPHFVVQLEGKLICGQYRQGDAVMPQADFAPNKAKNIPDAKLGRKLDF